ncbi:MAG: hypothetical protein M1825_006113 [Sarcosagium campestre]|nr:MAG: hypothetical protein M1825_006113 [Sarcosagium campestre]
MALSKSKRILILLAIDSCFFLLELIAGYAVHSLALVADSFHMLNDVLSLCVGLWAVNVAHQKPSTKFFTYGWQRAETLGALVNGVFLVALCLSIFLEAIQRFVEPQTVTNPLLVLVVGCCGLVSNILGLFLFHDHGHSHSHSHEPVATAEEGHNAHQIADESGNVADVLPSTVLATEQNGSLAAALPSHEAQGLANGKDHSSPLATHKPRATWKGHKRHSSGSRRRFPSADDINIHPASFRNDIIAAGRLDDIDSAEVTESEADEAVITVEPDESSPLLHKRASQTSQKKANIHRAPSEPSHATHKHSAPRDGSSSGGKGGHHSHGDLNMRGVFLHVMGDALGNIGVIASALIIWLTPFAWRFYSDPAISLVITLIILASAIPLCKAAARILLQAVPAGLHIDDIKDDIEELPGIVSAHHLHVWQLSDTKLVASLHVQVGFDFKGEGSARYMKLARAVRSCLHAYGIHSSTIQPEFCLDPLLDPSGRHHDDNDDANNQHGFDHADDTLASNGGSSADANAASTRRSSKRTSRTASPRSDRAACLLECGDECEGARQCCMPGEVDNHS